VYDKIKFWQGRTSPITARNDLGSVDALP